MGAIVWLASYPKSGNTWLRAFLHNLLRNPDEPADINLLDRFALGDSQKAWYREVAPRPLEDMSIREILSLTPAVHRRMTEAFPDSVFVKTHSRLGAAHGQPLITMDCTAGAIYIVRNPLDVALSVAHHFGLTADQAIDALNDPEGGTPADPVNIPQFYGSWSHHVQSWTHSPADTLAVVRYEDLHLSPLPTFGRIARFLGEWRDALNADQVRRLTEAHHEQMARFDYLP